MRLKYKMEWYETKMRLTIEINKNLEMDLNFIKIEILYVTSHFLVVT